MFVTEKRYPVHVCQEHVESHSLFSSGAFKWGCRFAPLHRAWSCFVENNTSWIQFM